jgi:hypothetical protein
MTTRTTAASPGAGTSADVLYRLQSKPLEPIDIIKKMRRTNER